MRKLLVRVFSGIFALGLLGGVFAMANAAASEPEAGKFFAETKNAQIYVNYQAPEHIGDYKGIFVQAKESGDSSVTLNHVLDLRMFTEKDTLLKVIPITTSPKQTRNDLELTEIIVRLTDVEDENVFVEMNVKAFELGRGE